MVETERERRGLRSSLAAGPVKRQVAVKSTRGFALKSTHGIAIKSTNMAAADKGESAPVRRTTRQFYDGEESCYIIDAKLEGNLGRYLNVSHCPWQGTKGECPLAAEEGRGRIWGGLSFQWACSSPRLDKYSKKSGRTAGLGGCFPRPH